MVAVRGIGRRVHDQARQGALGIECGSDRGQVLALGHEESTAETDPQIPLLGGPVLPGGVADQIIELPPSRPKLTATAINGLCSAAVSVQNRQ
ncbi:hypothetical protein [Nocardia paucivorans]|uniref:hypothetical protein n=1 Tax=Nocardia paucivorans TaxID=114259 RepID=UPI0012F72E1C|nr:hypothetical protein [Nocardia paucivorans]